LDSEFPEKETKGIKKRKPGGADIGGEDEERTEKKNKEGRRT